MAAEVAVLNLRRQLGPGDLANVRRRPDLDQPPDCLTISRVDRRPQGFDWFTGFSALHPDDHDISLPAEIRPLLLDARNCCCSIRSKVLD
jgi:hypothetical protein